MGAVSCVWRYGNMLKHAVDAKSEVLCSSDSSLTKGQNVLEQTLLLSWLLFLQKESKNLHPYLLSDKFKSFSGVREL